MPRFGATIAGLQTLGTTLDGVADKARTTMGVLGEARGAVGEMHSSLEQLDTKTDDSLSRQQQFQEEAKKTAVEISALNVIYDAAGERQNNFSQDIQLQIEAVRLGVISLQEFLAIYGDSLIMLEDGQHKIRDLFAGVDFNAYLNQIQALISGVRDGGTQLGDVLTYLQKNAATLAKGLIEAIQKFKDGKLGIEQLIALLERYKQDFSGDALGDLAGALVQGLLGGDLT
jgi:ABC-type transporter Mla subunit MlaD